MDESTECICAWGAAHYWDWCDLHEEYCVEIKCPVHFSVATEE